MPFQILTKRLKKGPETLKRRNGAVKRHRGPPRRKLLRVNSNAICFNATPLGRSPDSTIQEFFYFPMMQSDYSK